MYGEGNNIRHPTAEVNMNGEDKTALGITIVVVLLGILFVIAGHTEKMGEIKNSRAVICNQALVEAIPDPNDTEARSKFLKDCFKN